MSSWFEETMLEGLKMLEEEKKLPGYFPITSISNIPKINYPFLLEPEIVEIYEQAQEVLKLSRNINHYKEVAITYDLNEKNTESKYKKILGSYDDVGLMKDKSTKELITSNNEKHNLVVISLHNHPNDTSFSASDLLIFANNPSIKIMEVINASGEVSFLARPREIDLRYIILNIITEHVPDINNRMSQWLKNHNELDSLVDITNREERILIADDCLKHFQEAGICYCEYIGKDKENLIKFINIKDDEKRVVQPDKNIETIKVLLDSTNLKEDKPRKRDDYER